MEKLERQNFLNKDSSLLTSVNNYCFNSLLG